VSRTVPPTDRGRQFTEDFMKRFLSNVHPEELLDGLISVYDKYFSDEDIKFLIDFYQTPTGKKYLTSAPDIYRDSTAVGQKLGEIAGKKAMEETKKDYPDLFPPGGRGGPGIH
jgi:hypothetical protein